MTQTWCAFQLQLSSLNPRQPHSIHRLQEAETVDTMRFYGCAVPPASGTTLPATMQLPSLHPLRVSPQGHFVPSSLPTKLQTETGNIGKMFGKLARKAEGQLGARRAAQCSI